MIPQIPGMPSLNVNNGESEGEKSSDLLVPSEDGDLDVPSHSDFNDSDIKPPAILEADASLASAVVLPSAPSKGIEVVAVDKGFYNQNRYKEGDKFLIRNMQEFGEWMKCVDPIIEKKRVEHFKNKKARK